MTNLLALRRKLVLMEPRLPDLELGIDTARLRLDIHLHLLYWHARLHLGRPFLLHHLTSAQTPDMSEEHVPAGVLFARDAVDAVLTIIQLCQTIHNKIGLSQASYATEFMSCRAAMLVLIAKGISDMSAALSARAERVRRHAY